MGNVREEFASRLHQIINAWTKLLSGQTDRSCQQILSAFFRRYMEEEIGNISGRDQDRHFVITNFIAYSRFVQAIVDRAREICPMKQEVICFTTLTMLPTKWFNFREGPPGHPFPYCGTDERWNNYINHIKQMVQSPRFRMMRCLLAIDENFYQTALNRGGQFGPFNSEEQMRDHLNYFIMVPLNNNIPEWDKINPVCCDDPVIRNNNLLNQIYNCYTKAYLIAPYNSSTVSSIPLPPNYEWRKVGSAFIHMFHSHPTNDHARYCILSQTVWEEYYEQLSPRMPDDFFIVGFKQENQHPLEAQWKFCLAADADEKLDKILLEFITHDTNRERFDAIVGFTRWLIRTSQPLEKMIQRWK